MTTIQTAPEELPPSAQAFLHLLEDPASTELVINRHNQWFTRRDGVYRTEQWAFSSVEEYIWTLNYVLAVAGVAERIDGSVPVIEATWVTPTTHARIHIVCPPVAHEPALTAAKQRATRYSLADLTHNGTVGSEAAEFLRAAVHGRANLIISGGTGSGKTTLLNALLSEVPADERIVLIQDTPELLLHHENTTYLETRPVRAAVPWIRPEQINGLRAQWAQDLADQSVDSDDQWTDTAFWRWAGRRLNQMGSGAPKEKVSLKQLVEASLKMRSARIVVGEVIGPELVNLLLAMNSGYAGSAATLHASSARETVQKMEMLSQMGEGFSQEFTAKLISWAVDVIVQLAPQSMGRHRVQEVLEVEKSQTGEILTMRELFVYDRDTDTTQRRYEPSSNLRQRLEDNGLL